MHPTFPDLADLKTGSDAAWSIAFSYLWPIGLRAARVSTQLSAGEIEDAASQAIRDTVDKTEGVCSKEDLCALVAVIARRRAITMLREKFAGKRAPGGMLVQSFEATGPESFLAPDGACDPQGDVIAAETVLLLRQALAGLDSESERLLQEKYFEGYSYDELSKKYRQPVGTLCPKVMRALQKVRRGLQRSPRLMKELKDFLR